MQALLILFFFFSLFSTTFPTSLDEVLALCSDNSLSQLEQSEIINPDCSLNNEKKNVGKSPCNNDLGVDLNNELKNETKAYCDSNYLDSSFVFNLEFPSIISNNSIPIFDDCYYLNLVKKKNYLKRYKSSCNDLRLTNSEIERVDHRYFSKNSNIF